MKSQDTTIVTCKHCGCESKTVICTSCFLNYEFTRYECSQQDSDQPLDVSGIKNRDEMFDIERIEALYDPDNHEAAEAAYKQSEFTELMEDPDAEDGDEPNLFSWFTRMPKM